jgi:uncharacterized membrane protein
MNKDIYKLNFHWRELDILRGLAAILMIINHVGYKTLPSNLTEGGLSGTLIFIGSFAPAIFFFVTGVGYGIQSNRVIKKDYWSATLKKVLILVLADQLLFWNEGRWLGLDFLGFIGFSSLVLAWLRSSKMPLTYCLTGFIAIPCARYLIGPYIHSLGADRGLLAWIFGVSGISGISYPLSPWLAYPLAGYLVGVALVRYRDFLEHHRQKVIVGLLTLAIFPGFGGMILSQAGSSFHRWGTVAVGFFVVSFTVIFVGLAGSLLLCSTSRFKILEEAVSLKGVSSLAVVFIHYYLIDLVRFFGIKDLDIFNFLLLAIAVLITSFLISHKIEHVSKEIYQLKNKRKIFWIMLTILFLSVNIMLYTKSIPILSINARIIGQTILCCLFVI